MILLDEERFDSGPMDLSTFYWRPMPRLDTLQEHYERPPICTATNSDLS